MQLYTSIVALTKDIRQNWQRGYIGQVLVPDVCRKVILANKQLF